MKYVSGRLRKLELGLSSHSETKQTLNVIGNADITGIASASAFADFDYLQAPYGSTVSFTVTVAAKSGHRYQGQGSGNAYLINGVQAPVLTLTPGRTYRFTNDNTGSHPLKFYYEADKTTEYTTGVSFQNTYTEITVSDTTPNVLHYQCTSHQLMGNAVVTNSNVVDSPYAATLRDSLTVSGNITANGNILGDNATNISGINSVTATSFFGDGSGLVDVVIPGISTSGTTELTNLEILGNLKVAGVSTFGNDKVIVGGATTDLLVNGSARVTGELKVGDGTITLNSAGLSTFPTGVDVSGGSGLIASSAKISDLTSGRIVFAGAGGELEDSANLTFDGTTLSGSFSGDGSGLSGVSIPGINTSGTTEFANLDLSGTLKVAGVSTFSGNINANGNIVGDNSTNITGIAGVTATTLAGTLQTAAQPNITSLGTLSSLTVSGAIDANGSLDVDGHTELDDVNVSGVSTFTGAIDANGSLDVDGHTELDDVNVSGASTFATAKVTDLTDNRIVIAGTGGELEDTSKLTFDGTTLAIVGDATFTGNVSVAGTLTSEDKTNIDSLGIVTARTGVRISSGGLVVTSGVSTFTDAITANGNINANGNIVGDSATNISGINNVSASTLTGTLQTAAQPNVTSLGTITNLVASSAKVSDLTSGRVVYVGTAGELQDISTFTFNGSTVTAPAFAGDGSALTGITAGGVGAIGGLTVKDEGVVVGTAGSIATLDFLGGGVSVIATSGAAGVATVTVATVQNPDVQTLNVSGVSTLSANAGPTTISPGNITISPQGANSASLTINSTESSAAAGPVINLVRDDGAPTTNDYLGIIKFNGSNSAGQQIDYVKLSGKILDVTDTTEDAALEIKHYKAGSETVTSEFRSDGLYLLNDSFLNVTGISTFGDDVELTGGQKHLTLNGQDKKLIFKNGGTDKLEIFHDDGGGGSNKIYSNAGSQPLKIHSAGMGGIELFVQVGAGLNKGVQLGAQGDVIPSSNNSIDLGTNNNRFGHIYGGDGIFSRDIVVGAGLSVAGVATVTGNVKTTGYFSANDDIYLIGSGGGSYTQLNTNSKDILIDARGNSNKIMFRTASGGNNPTTTNGWDIDSSGHLLPSSDSSRDIGTNSVRVQNIYADTLYGDGSNLTGITAGATLSAASGSQRLVLTSLTSGTMTSAATDADLSFDATDNLLNAGKLLIAGISTFSDDVTFKGATSGRNITFDQTNNRMIFDDDAHLILGSGGHLIMYHNSSNGYFTNYTGNVNFDSPATKQFNFNRKVSIGEDLEVDGVAELDDVNVAGVSTFADDVTFTSANGNNILFDKSDNALEFGNGVKSIYNGNLEIYNDGNNRLKANSGGIFFGQPGSFLIGDGSFANTRFEATGTHAILYSAGVKVARSHTSRFEVGNPDTGIGIGATIFTSGDARFVGVVTASSFVGDGSGLTGISAGGGGDKFNTTITNSVQASVYGYETNIISLPSDSTKRYVIESISLGNVTAAVGSTVNVIASINPGVTTYSSEYKVYLAYNAPVPDNGLIELIKQPMVMNPSDVLKVWATDSSNTGINGALELYATYTEHDSTDYIAGYGSTTNITTTALATIYTSTSYPTIIQSIKATNRTDTGDFPVTIQIVNGSTITHLAKDFIVPRYASVEFLDRPKRIEAGATIRMQQSSAANTVDVIVSGKKITS